MSTNTNSMQILAIGGGKGGVGKSFISCNLAVALAEAGHHTTLIDLDLGGANLHTLLGITNSERGIGDFIYSHKSANLEDFRTPTNIPRLHLVSGSGFIPGIANLGYQQKLKVLKGVSRIRSEYVVLDLGAGTSYNVIDFFSMTQAGLLVTMAEPTAILNAYEFLKNVLFRMFETRFKAQPAIMHVIETFKVQDEAGAETSVKGLVKAVGQADAEAGELMRKMCADLRPGLVLNMVQGDDMRLGDRLREICKRFLDVEVAYLGAAPAEEEVKESLRKMRPVLLEYPESNAAQAVRTIARKCMLGRWTSAQDVAQMSGPAKPGGTPEGADDHTDISELVAIFMSEMAAAQEARAAEASAEAPALFDPFEWLRPALRVDERRKLPRFMAPPETVQPAPPSFFARFGAAAHATGKSLKIIRSIPAAENTAMAIENAGHHVEVSDALGLAWTEVGARLVEFNQYFAALRAYEKAARCLPGNPAALNNCGAALIAVGKAGSAKALFGDALKLAPNHHHLLFNMGLTYFLLGEYMQAQACFERVRHLKDKHTAPTFLAACCLYHLNDRLRAQTLFQLVAEADVADTFSRFNAAICQLKTQFNADAITTLSQLLVVSPDDDEALAARGLANWQEHQESAALEDLGKAIQLKPSNLAYRATRSAMAVKAGRLNMAVEDIQAITELLPANQRYQSLLGAIQGRLGAKRPHA